MKYFSFGIILASTFLFTGCGTSTSVVKTTPIVTITSGTVVKPNTNTAIKTYTLQDVQAHATAKSCRSLVRNQVYDFTTRASQHPGWADKILAICWKDATSIFEKVHGGKNSPEMKLKDFYIGNIK